MKTTIEYLQALEDELKYLPKKEVRRVVQIYQDKINNAIDCGEKIEKVLKDLPNPSDVAKGIYDSKKVNYLDRKKREYQRKELLGGLSSLVISVLVVLIFVGIIGYLGIMTFRMFEIVPKFSSQDKIIMSGFVIMYFMAMLIILIYLVDLALLITNFLLGKFFYLFPSIKEKFEKVEEFTISGALEKVTKKKYFLGKVLLVFGILALLFGVTSLVGKGYLYRSFMDIPSEKNEEVFDVSSEIEEIILETSKAQVLIKKGDSFQIIKTSEFDRNFQLNQTGSKLEIEFDEKTNYDFLGILSEPTILITITIPEDKVLDIDLKINNGKIGLTEVSLGVSDIYLTSGEIAIKDIDSTDFTLYTDSGTINSNSSKYEKTNIEIVRGKYASSEDYYKDIYLQNGSGEIAIKENEYDSFELKNISGTSIIQNCSIDQFDYHSVASILNMTEIVSTTFNLTSTNASQFTMVDMKADIFNFDLNTGYITMSKVVGDINIIQSLSNITLSELVGDVNGKIANSKLAVYNSIFNKLDVELSKCNLDLDNVVIKEIDVLAENTQLLLIDVYGNNMRYEITNSNMQYYNNDSKKLINKIVLKNVNSQYDIDETVNCGELKIE